MPFKSRFLALGGTCAIVLACALLSVISPIHISISFERDDAQAAAAPARSIDATATPVPPTSTPPATSTARPATRTPVPPTSTPLPTATTPPQPSTTATPRTPGTHDDPTPAPPATATAPAATLPPEQPHVSVTKSADPSTVKPGDTVVFSLVAKNTGSTIARDVVVSDVVPEVFKVIDLSSTKGDVAVEGQNVTAYPATLAPGESVTITITARVKNDAAAGQYRNTALVTTSTPNDDPGDNTSTIVVTVEPPPAPQKQAPPANKQVLPVLPRTADPDAPTLLMVYGPWMMLALFLGMFGFMVRVGMFRTRFVSVSLAPFQKPAPAVPVPALPQPQPILVEGIELEARELVQRWQNGTSIVKLSNEIAAANPHANKLLISLAVRQIIGEEL